MTHIPVLTKEVLEYLDPKPNENIVDGTVGQGGHAILILQKNKPEGKVLGIDLDRQQIENSTLLLSGFKERVILVNDSYANIKEIVKKSGVAPIHGILLDLGYSSWQLSDSKKGFSFNKDEPLDMRYNTANPLTAEKLINEYPEQQLLEIIKEYGQEKFARQITREIVRRRAIIKITTTFGLKEIIEKAVPKKFQYGKIHCATRTFQALRIAVNGELANLEKALPDVLDTLSLGGRLVVISFHSLEDRIVKHFFKEKEQLGLVKIVTKKPVIANQEQLETNPRARSAKLRAIVKLASLA